MTTPAVSINQTVTSPANLVLSYKNGTESTTLYGNPPTRRIYIQRPVSVNNPLIKGWRRPWDYFRTDKFQASNRGSVIQTYEGVYPGNGLVRETWLGDSFWQENSFPLQTFSVPWETLEDLALTAALNKLKGNNVQIGVALAEAKQTAALLSNNTREVANGVKNFRRRYPKLWDVVKATQRGHLIDRKAWKKIPGRWLELQYGWNPLMSDIASACNSLEQTWNTHYPLVGAQATAVMTQILERTGSGQYGSSRKERTDALHGFKACLYFQLQTPWLAQFNALGLVNPWAIVWEKVPYSFVVDWFLPIGGWISALDADFGYSWKGGSGTSFTKGRGYIISETVKKRAANWTVSTTGSRVDSRYSDMNRRRYIYQPVPLVHFKNPFSAKHVANAMSLLVQAFS